MRLRCLVKRILIFCVCFLSACATATPGTESPSPTVAVDVEPTATSGVESYQVGEPITFAVDDLVYVCEYFTDEIPYSIVQVTEAGERRVALRHSCTGFIGQGVDEYCENGEIRREAVEVGKCSDDVGCGEVAVKETFTWDQQEYVKVTETCAGETIQREVKQQAPEGVYRVVVEQQTDDGEIVTRVVVEFEIVRDE